MREFLKNLEACPACRDQFADHQFSLLASVPIRDNKDPRPTIFRHAIKEHDWRRVLAFQEWAGGYDNYELYGIRAKHHPVVLVIVWDPVELFCNERIVGTEILNEAETKELLSLTANKDWKSSSKTA